MNTMRHASITTIKATPAMIATDTHIAENTGDGCDNLPKDLNLKYQQLTKHPLGYFQVHVQFNEKIDIEMEETEKTSFPVRIKGIKIQLYPNGFHIMKLDPKNVSKLGYILDRMTDMNRSLLDRIKDDAVASEDILLGRRK